MKLPSILRRCAPVVLPLLAAVLLCGCSVFDVFSVDLLIRAPKLTGSNARIQQAFEAQVGRDVQLINPLLGEYRSSFVLYDYNNDGREECLVFYARNDLPGEVHLHLMEQLDGAWVAVGDIIGNGTEVYSVDFYNIDAESDTEIAVAWTVSDSRRNKTLVLYKYDRAQEESISQLFVVQMFDYLVRDFDSDGVNELLYLYNDAVNQSSAYKMSLIKAFPESGSFLPLSEISLSSSVETPAQMCCDVKNASYRIYIDCLLVGGGYATDIIYYDLPTAALVRPVAGEGESFTDLTYRTAELYCLQEKEDSRVSVPVQYTPEDAFLSDSEKGLSVPLRFTAYARLEEDGLVMQTERYYYNTDVGFRVRVDGLTKDFLIVFEGDTSMLKFFHRDRLSVADCSVRFDIPESGANDQTLSYTVRPSVNGILTEERVRSLIELL